MMFLSDLIFLLGCLTLGVYLAAIGILLSGVVMDYVRRHDGI